MSNLNITNCETLQVESLNYSQKYASSDASLPTIYYKYNPLKNRNYFSYTHVHECELMVLQNTKYTLQTSEIYTKISSYFTHILDNKIEDYDWSLKLLEDITTLSYLLSESYQNNKINKCKLIFAITNFIKLRSHTSLLKTIFQTKLHTYASQLFEKYTATTVDHENDVADSMNLQSFEENISNFRDYFDKFDSIKHSEFYKKTYKLCLYAMSLSLFDKVGLSFTNLGYSMFEAESIKKKHYLGVDFYHTLVDTLLFLCERGFQILRTGDVQHLFHSGKTYVDFLDQYNLIKRQSVLLSNPEAHGFNESSFRANLDDSIEKGENICAHGNKLSEADKRMLRSMVNDLQFIRCDLCTKRAAREHRKAPFSVLIFGESGIGKSTIKDMLFYHYAKIKDLDSDSSFCYTRNPVANFWDGFTTSQWAVVLDDIASINPNKAPTGDPSMMELIQIVNSVPFVPDQADLSNKGRTPLKCQFVMATTNVKHLHAFQYFSHPSAVQRRLPFIITPSVKPKYANPDGTLNSNLVINVEGQYPDLWNWKVEKVLTSKIGAANKLAEIEIIIDTDDIIEFLQWFNKAVQNFDKNQALVSESIELMKTIEVCKGCFLPKANCVCEIQSGEDGKNFFIGVLDDTVFTIYKIFCYFIFQIIDEYLERFICYRAFKNSIWLMLSAKMQYRIIKSRVYSMGEIVKNSIGYPKYLISFVMFLTCYMTLSKFTQLFRSQGGESSSIGSRPSGSEDARENIWYKNDFQLSPIDLTPKILSSKGLSRDEFNKMISRNLVHFNLKTRPGKEIPSKAICIKGQKYMTNNHNIPAFEGVMDLEIIVNNTKDGISENMIVSISESQIVRDILNDLLIITIPNLPPKKDISEYFAKDRLDIKTKGYYYSRNRDSSLCINNLSCIKLQDQFSAPISTFCGSVWFSNSTDTTVLGDCGSVMIGETARGYVILGIHMLGSSFTSSVGAICITKGILDKIVFEDMYTIQCGHASISSKSVERHLGDLHNKSVVRYLEKGVAAVHGSFVGFRPTHKSSVCVSPMAHFLTNHDYKIKCGPPVMKGWAPWRIAAQDMVNPVVKINNSILNECVDAFTEDIFSQITDLSQVEVYDNFTSINGAQGIAYVDKINRNTSAGNPWKKSKKFFMKDAPPAFGMEDPVEVDEEIMDRVDEIIRSYHNGTRAMPNFCAHLKDEAVSFKKMKSGKTRVFTGAPFDWTIVVRKYLLSTIRLIQNNRFVFESAPGTVAQSYEWTQLYNYITTHGEDRIIGGDYKSFDKSMSPAFILASFEILKRICIKSENYSKDDIRVIDGIAQDTAFPLVDFNGDLIQFFGSNPSGHPLTVIINGLCNSLYMRYAYKILNPLDEVKSFKSNVSLMTYGDDNIMSVSRMCNWYNHTSVSQAFAAMGITYTMADKEAESIPYIHINEASFLKRSWIYNEELQAHFAMLEHESIEKMLMVWVASKSISQEEQCIAVITSAIREYFFYGKDVFNQKSKLLKELTAYLDIEDWVDDSTFPTWESLVNDFNQNTQRLVRD
jgi:hypothetical protein